MFSALLVPPHPGPVALRVADYRVTSTRELLRALYAGRIRRSSKSVSAIGHPGIVEGRHLALDSHRVIDQVHRDCRARPFAEPQV